ncbi:MAG: adenylate/guanylate cyclase domain-containing protein [Bacteroidales bacterium]|nr:adenylate/guanylate cyclase domain-containing protein [Bacteroidales bacterium]
MKYFLIVSLHLFISTILIGQSLEHGVPAIKNYSPKKYGQESQNFSVLQNQNHVMYFGNSNGIMEFDNTTWQLIKVMGRPVMDINKKNEIYYGGYNQFGKLNHENGLTTTQNIDYYSELKPGQVQKVVALENEVFFTTSHQLLIYENDTLILEQSNAEGIDIYKQNDHVLIYMHNRGIYLWKNKKFEKHPGYNLFRGIDIMDIIVLNDNDFLIKPKNDKGFLIYKNSKLSKFNTEADDFINANSYRLARLMNNNLLIVGTQHGGIVCIDLSGNYIYSISRDNGLMDNHITDIFVDNKNHVWLTTYNGITLIEANSDLSFFESSFGFNGAVISIKRYKNQLYLGTASGVYRYYNGNIYDQERNVFDFRLRFDKIEGIRAMCWQLIELGNSFYAFTNEGIYEINDLKAKLVMKGSFNSFLKLSYFQNKYLVGSSDGLLIADIKNQKIDTLGYLKGLNYNIRSMNEDYFGNVWMGTNGDGLFETGFYSGVSNDVSFSHYDEKSGLPKAFDWIDVFNSFQGTLFSTSKGVCRYNYSSNEFVLDTLLNFDFKNGDKHLYPIIEDGIKNLWYSCIYDGRYERETGVLVFNGANKKYTRLVKPFLQLSEYVIESIYPENDSVVWFGSSDALIKYNKSKTKVLVETFPCYIRVITIGKDSVIHISANEDISKRKISYDFKDKTIRFDFSGIAYSTYGEILYRVKLEGFDDDWSAWTTEAFKEYTSLVEKDYTFKVQAKDVYGNISNELSLKFEVKAPFYRTIYAFIIYLIVFAAIIYLVLKLNELRHAKERYSLEKLVEDRTNELAYQKEQTEQLVKKLLPQNAADEIRETGKAKSQKYEMVTVLFADIQGFTEIAEKTKPEDLIKHLNHIFSSFDKIITDYNIEKIKTIGDAYMCAGGMPTKDITNPIEVVLAALEMQRKIKSINEESDLKLEIRIGIHSGPVVAGVVGSKKLEYDIWGDTVNIASRMESHGLINKVNISEETYKHVKDFFVCQYRGRIAVKYKGEMEMYFVHEVRKVLSVNADRQTPNSDFIVKLQFIKFKMMQEDIMDQLQRNLPANLYYHNIKHTINVLYNVEDIAREEGVSEEEMLLLKCAALFHDAGFMVSYDNNEEIGAKMAAQTLQKFKFTDEQIETVKRLILATKMPPKPKDHLEKIMCDADLDYLGRPDFIPISQNLFRELFERGKINTIEQWNRMQYKFIVSHNYFTETARKNRDAGKELVMKELKELI